ncbi:MAG: AMP-binding protein [Pseudomonadota bacterium]
MERRLIKDLTDWQTMRAAFRWQVPGRFNIAEACCDSWARAEPGRTAVIHLDTGGSVRRWRYGDLKEASDRLAAALAARGVASGDRVAILLSQHPAVLISHFAAHKLGAVSLPLFTLFGPDALAYRLSDSSAVAIVTDGSGVEKLAPLAADLPRLKTVFNLDGPSDLGPAFWEDIERTDPIAAPADTAAEDPAVMIYTSGTTGPPKGVLHAHRFLLGHLPSIEVHHEAFPQPGDMGWTPADWAWIGGLMDMAMPCLYYGVPQVCHRFAKFDPAAAYALIRQFSVRNLFLPPTALKLMRAAGAPEDLGIRSIGSGGEALGADLLSWGRDVLGAPINEIYGQTECNLVTASCTGSMEVRPGTIGQAVPGHEVAVIDGAGAVQPAGTLGQIAVRAPDPVIFLRYWNKPEQTAEKFLGDWLLTGDLGTADGDGYITFAGRDDDVISSAGYRIGPSEIENCLTAHADVVMAAAVGAPDPVRGSVVHAFVVLRRGAAPEGLSEILTDRVRTHVSPHVAPRRIEFIDEMPMTATGKIMRRVLRDRFG